MKPESRATLLGLRVFCHATIKAHDTRIAALKDNDATDAAVRREVASKVVWEEYEAALDDALAEGNGE